MKLTLDDFRAIAQSAIDNLDDEPRPLQLSEWILRLGRTVRAAAAEYVSGLDADDES